MEILHSTEHNGMNIEVVETQQTINNNKQTQEIES